MGKTIAPEVRFAIHETYYEGDKPTAITTDAMKPYGETLEELKSDLEKMVVALDKPVLEWEDFKNNEVENVQAIGGSDRG
jgi:hypothetical protein